MSRIEAGRIYSKDGGKELVLVSKVDGHTIYGTSLNVKSGERTPVVFGDGYLSPEPVSNDEAMKVYLDNLGELHDFFGIVLSPH